MYRGITQFFTVVLVGIVGFLLLPLLTVQADQVCPPAETGWTKIDSGDISLYPVAGADQYCLKAGTEVLFVDALDCIWQPEDQEFRCNGMEHGLSHWAYHISAETETPTDVPDTPTPTEPPDTATPTEPPPTETPTEPPDTETPTEPPPTETPTEPPDTATPTPDTPTPTATVPCRECEPTPTPTPPNTPTPPTECQWEWQYDQYKYEDRTKVQYLPCYIISQEVPADDRVQQLCLICTDQLAGMVWQTTNVRDGAVYKNSCTGEYAYFYNDGTRDEEWFSVFFRPFMVNNERTSPRCLSCEEQNQQEG